MMTRRAVGYRSKRCWCWFPGIRPEQSKCFSHIFSQLFLLLCPIYVWIGVSSSQEKTNSLFWLAGLWMFRHRVAAPPPPSYPMACRTQWRPTLSDKTSFLSVSSSIFIILPHSFRVRVSAVCLPLFGAKNFFPSPFALQFLLVDT